MTAPRFRCPVSPAAAPSRSGDQAASQSLVVPSSTVLETPVPAEAPAGRPAPVRLSDFGDVLTDRDLAALLQVSPRWAEKRRHDAKVARRAPDLPAAIPGCAQPRYRAVDVDHWLKTGSRVRVELARPRRVS